MLQTRTIEPRTLELLRKLMAIPEFDAFYLVGGTALALQLGHRISIDLDLFTLNSFEKVAVLDRLNESFEVIVESEEGIRMLHIKDIAPMKLKAITQRGSKKDFYDLYFLLEKLTLSEILELFAQKFKQHELFHVVKSLTYFEDAELNPEPLVFDKKITWNRVKMRIKKEVVALAN
jgi:hypothetical protein